jgi:hypothetical protein
MHFFNQKNAKNHAFTEGSLFRNYSTKKVELREKGINL